MKIHEIIEANCNYSVGYLGVIGTSYHINKNKFEVHIKDGDLQQDMATVHFLRLTYFSYLYKILSQYSIILNNFIFTGHYSQYQYEIVCKNVKFILHHKHAIIVVKKCCAKWTERHNFHWTI